VGVCSGVTVVVVMQHVGRASTRFVVVPCIERGAVMLQMVGWVQCSIVGRSVSRTQRLSEAVSASSHNRPGRTVQSITVSVRPRGRLGCGLRHSEIASTPRKAAHMTFRTDKEITK
jgi:hypothetical protein